MQQELNQHVETALGQGLSPAEVAQGLRARFPDLTLDEAAAAIRHLASLAAAAPAPRAMAKAMVAGDPEAATAGALTVVGPVENAAYQAWLLRLAFPDATPADVAALVGPPNGLTLTQTAQVLKYGQPYPVFPDLAAPPLAAALVDPRLGAATADAVATALHSAGVFPAMAAVDLGLVLLGAGIFPTLTADGMRAALTAAGYAPADVAAAVAALFPAPTPVTPVLLVNFTGANQVQIPPSPAYDFASNQDFTVELWIRAPAQANLHSYDNNVVEKWIDDGGGPGYRGYPFAVRILNQNSGNDAGKIRVQRFDLSNVAAITSSRGVLDDQYHHVAFTKAGGQLTLYLDGAVEGTTTDTTTGDTTNDAPLYLGVRGGSMWPDNFTGRILEVRIWNVARSQQDIAANLRTTLAGNEPGLVGYWKLREGTGTTAVDSTAAANSGTITDPGWSPAPPLPLYRTLGPSGVQGAMPFDDTAAALALGQPLTRLVVRHGNIVDAVQAFYGGARTPLESHGGGGGGATEVVLDPGDAITQVRGYYGGWFGGSYILQLTLVTGAGKTYGPFGDMAYAYDQTPFGMEAGPGESVVALLGSAAWGNNGQSVFLGSLGVTVQPA